MNEQATNKRRLSLQSSLYSLLPARPGTDKLWAELLLPCSFAHFWEKQPMLNSPPQRVIRNPSRWEQKATRWHDLQKWGCESALEVRLQSVEISHSQGQPHRGSWHWSPALRWEPPSPRAPRTLMAPWENHESKRSTPRACSVDFQQTPNKAGHSSTFKASKIRLQAPFLHKHANLHFSSIIDYSACSFTKIPPFVFTWAEACLSILDFSTISVEFSGPPRCPQLPRPPHGSPISATAGSPFLSCFQHLLYLTSEVTSIMPFLVSIQWARSCELPIR